MPCGHSRRSRSGGSRRDFLRAAVAIGGASALGACLERESSTDRATEQEYPQGPTDLSSIPDSQFAWQEYLVYDRFGNSIFPEHHSILLLDYVDDVPPTAEDRNRVEASFQTLERAFQRGTGGKTSAVQHEGLLFTVGYSPTYFERFDESLPDSIDLPHPETVLAELDEDEPTADEYDVAIHLASGYASVVLAAEHALLGELDRLNGVPVEGTLSGLFEINDRRTGFIGKGRPAREYEHEDIPDGSPLSMGFKGGFGDNLQSENRIAIESGPFAGGTTQQVSRVEIDLDGWYELDQPDQVHQMYSHEHTPENVGEFGEKLAGHSGKTEATAENLEAVAKESGHVGHGAKLARARDDDFLPVILRRDFDATGEPGLHFDSWQRHMDDFVKTRKAMNGTEFETIIERKHNGILSFLEVTNRATFLIPPRRLRALPSPNP